MFSKGREKVVMERKRDLHEFDSKLIFEAREAGSSIPAIVKDKINDDWKSIAIN